MPAGKFLEAIDLIGALPNRMTTQHSIQVNGSWVCDSGDRGTSYAAAIDRGVVV